MGNFTALRRRIDQLETVSMNKKCKALQAAVLALSEAPKAPEGMIFEIAGQKRDLHSERKQLQAEVDRCHKAMVCRRLASQPAVDSGFSLFCAPLLFIFFALAYLVWRRISAPRRTKDYGKFVKHGSRLVPAWRQAHEESDPYNIV